MTRLKHNIWLTLFLLLAFNSFAQTKTDSLIQNHSPVKATLLSLALPGAGQFYNKKYWKIPVLYAGFGITGYLIKFNDDEYKIYKQAVAKRTDGDPLTIDEFADLNDSELNSQKDFYRRNRDLSYIITGLLYALNILDAHVDAHLYYFDVSDDLSMSLNAEADFTHAHFNILSLTYRF